MATRCTAHAEGQPSVSVEEGSEKLRVERTTVGGRVQVRYRLYDRAADRFIDLGTLDHGGGEN